MRVPDEFFQGIYESSKSVGFESLPSSTQHLSLLRLLSFANCRFLKYVSTLEILNFKNVGDHIIA